MGTPRTLMLGGRLNVYLEHCPSRRTMAGPYSVSASPIVKLDASGPGLATKLNARIGPDGNCFPSTRLNHMAAVVLYPRTGGIADTYTSSSSGEVVGVSGRVTFSSISRNKRTIPSGPFMPVDDMSNTAIWRTLAMASSYTTMLIPGCPGDASVKLKRLVDWIDSAVASPKMIEDLMAVKVPAVAVVSYQFCAAEVNIALPASVPEFLTPRQT